MPDIAALAGMRVSITPEQVGWAFCGLRVLELALEEIYPYVVADGGIAYQRAYGPGLDICCEVRSGDTVLLPHGYHGPSMAAPGYDLYYLNVMAGPGERAWRFTDDPAHAWIRDTWASREIDRRLPMARARRHA